MDARRSLLDALFPAGHDVEVDGSLIHGIGVHRCRTVRRGRRHRQRRGRGRRARAGVGRTHPRRAGWSAAAARVARRHQRAGAAAARGADRAQRLPRACRSMRRCRAAQRLSVAVARLRRGGERRLPEPRADGRSRLRARRRADPRHGPEAMARVTQHCRRAASAARARIAGVRARREKLRARWGRIEAIWAEPSAALLNAALAELAARRGARATRRGSRATSAAEARLCGATVGGGPRRVTARCMRRHDWVYLHRVPCRRSRHAKPRRGHGARVGSARGGSLVVTRQNAYDEASVASGSCFPRRLAAARSPARVPLGDCAPARAGDRGRSRERSAARRRAGVVAIRRGDRGQCNAARRVRIHRMAIRHRRRSIGTRTRISTSFATSGRAPDSSLASRLSPTPRGYFPSRIDGEVRFTGAARSHGANCTKRATAAHRWSSRRACATSRCSRCGRSWRRCDDSPDAQRAVLARRGLYAAAAGAMLPPSTSAGWRCAPSTTRPSSIPSPAW